MGYEGISSVVHSMSKDPLLFYPMCLPGGVAPFFTRPWVRAKDGIERAVLAGPNQGGKTYSGAIETVFRMRGNHPWRKSANLDRPVHGWMVCMATKQSLAAQRVLYEVVPKHLLHPKTDFNDSRGFLNQQLKVKHVSGGWSLLDIKTIGEGSKDGEGTGLNSATLDFIWPDEPFPQGIWNELQARLLVRRGSLYCTLTCVGSPVEWLRKMVEDGRTLDSWYDTPQLEHYDSKKFSYTRFALHKDNVRHFNEQQIAGIADTYLEAEKKQRVGGYWDGPTPDRYIQYDPAKNKISFRKFRQPGVSWRVGIGYDHGVKPGTQSATIALWNVQPEHCQVHALATVCDLDHSTTPDQDAENILDELERHNLKLTDVDLMVGDVNTAGKSFDGASMNEVLGFALLKAYYRRMGMNVDPRANPIRIETAQKGAGSVSWGCRIVNSGFLQGHFSVGPGNDLLDKSLQRWKGEDKGDDAQWKHHIDGFRYIVTRAIGDHVAYRCLRLTG